LAVWRLTVPTGTAKAPSYDRAVPDFMTGLGLAGSDEDATGFVLPVAGEPLD
jgi:hypothetical protein